MTNSPETIYLKDYTLPSYLLKNTELTFELGEEATLVRSMISMFRNPDADINTPLELYGVDLELKSLGIDGSELTGDQYEIKDEVLTIPSAPDELTLECVTIIKPQENTSLEGLYKSRTMFCTQCEAEGFRKITYYPDRPDVMSKFTTTIKANKEKYPVLLSNGNLTDKGDNPDGTHWATWEDPFKKPSYLFALVAGDLEHIKDTFITASGREIDLQIFVEEKDLDKCDHAMAALKKAMKWDEVNYGREYDLDIYMIVAVDDFNMGAMENKGLNIFNTSCVLANPDITLDSTFQRIETIIAHEYFHNWSGNRVTCRDWFQLSLKEGFTVFRDGQFTADISSPTEKRVSDATVMRTAQFAEDAGPMAHPVQPASFMEISNFYTLTIYRKGAEVVRMIQTLLGEESFRKGTDLYFERHDGEAVTIDDFLKAMEDVSRRDLTQFKRWYTQAGTPRLEVEGSYDEAKKEYTLSVKQSCPPTPEKETKDPFHIPFRLSLIGEAGPIPLKLSDNDPEEDTELTLEITDKTREFRFTDVQTRPVPSMNRGFAAPVKVDFDYPDEDLIYLMTRDSDGFNRWDACQKLGQGALEQLMKNYRSDKKPELDNILIDAYRRLLSDKNAEKGMTAIMLTPPSEAYMMETAEVVDIEAIHNSIEFLANSLATELKKEFINCYLSNQHPGPYSVSKEAISQRTLKNRALSYLMRSNDEDIIDTCIIQYKDASNMSDRLSALSCLVNSNTEEGRTYKNEALDDFYSRFKDEPLAVNLWLSVQAGCRLKGTLDRVKELMVHEAFDMKNPNKLRALIGTFCGLNNINFHNSDGSGYDFLTEQIIILNKQNPQVASRMLAPFTKWKKFDTKRRDIMKQALINIQDSGNLSKDVYEVVSKSLK